MILKYALVGSIGAVIILMIANFIKYLVQNKKANELSFVGRDMRGEIYVFIFIAGMIFHELNIIRLEYRMPDSTFGSSKECMATIVIINVIAILFIVYNLIRKNACAVFENEIIRCGGKEIAYEKIDAITGRKIPDKKNAFLVDLNIYLNKKVYSAQSLNEEQYECFKKKVPAYKTENIFDHNLQQKNPGVGVMYLLLVWILLGSSLILSAARELIIVSIIGIIAPGLFMSLYGIIFILVTGKIRVESMEDAMANNNK